MWQAQRKESKREFRRKRRHLQVKSWACIEEVHDCHREDGALSKRLYCNGTIS